MAFSVFRSPDNNEASHIAWESGSNIFKLEMRPSSFTLEFSMYLLSRTSLNVICG